jgi:RimJ/RimL family protein N-acetyltransferase/predicted kinase
MKNKCMNIKLLSEKYNVRKITEEDIPSVYRLMCGNPQYFHYCPPKPSEETVREDMQALPQHMTEEDKYYLGFFQKDDLTAVMDLIIGYPDEDTAFIGFFMMDRALQGKGEGSKMIAESLQYLSSLGFKRAMLGRVKGNPQPEAFWEKNQFVPTGTEIVQESYTVVAMERELHAMEKKLIILRGNSGSGKTTVARAVQKMAGRNILLLSQDNIRREMLNANDGINTKALPLLQDLLAYGYSHCSLVILEGILNAKWYRDLFEQAIRLYGKDNIYAYYFDIPFEETLRRHQTRPNHLEFGEEEMRDWWKAKDYLNCIEESLFTETDTEEDEINRICSDAGVKYRSN